MRTWSGAHHRTARRSHRGVDEDDPPRIDTLARRIADATRDRYGTDLSAPDSGSEIPVLIQGAVNASSPAWHRLDTLIRAELDA